MEKNFAKPAIEHTNTPPTFPIPSIVQVSRHSIDRGIYQLLEVRAVQRVTVNKKVHIERERKKRKQICRRTANKIEVSFQSGRNIVNITRRYKTLKTLVPAIV